MEHIEFHRCISIHVLHVLPATQIANAVATFLNTPAGRHLNTEFFADFITSKKQGRKLREDSHVDSREALLLHACYLIENILIIVSLDSVKDACADGCECAERTCFTGSAQEILHERTLNCTGLPIEQEVVRGDVAVYGCIKDWAGEQDTFAEVRNIDNLFQQSPLLAKFLQEDFRGERDVFVISVPEV